VGIGVDRLDYTKGHPGSDSAASSVSWKEIRPTSDGLRLYKSGAPSRTHIARYQDLISEVESEASVLTAASRQITGTHPVPEEASHSQRGRAALSCRRLVPGDVVA